MSVIKSYKAITELRIGDVIFAKKGGHALRRVIAFDQGDVILRSKKGSVSALDMNAVRQYWYVATEPVPGFIHGPIQDA